MNLRTKLTIKNYIIGCLVLLIITGVLDDIWVVEENFYKNMLMNILPTISSFLGLGAVWEMVGKRSFSKDILNLVGVSDNYIDSGITYVFESFKDINWKDELTNVKNFTVFFVYGYTWRNYNRKILTRFAENKKNKFIAILPDYKDSDIISELDKRFCYGEYSVGEKKDSTKERIKEAIDDFIEIGASVKLYKGTICSTYYFMDDKCIYAPFKHGEKRIEVPAIRVNKYGKLYDFCMIDKKLIEDNSIDYEG